MAEVRYWIPTDELIEAPKQQGTKVEASEIYTSFFSCCRQRNLVAKTFHKSIKLTQKPRPTKRVRIVLAPVTIRLRVLDIPRNKRLFAHCGRERPTVLLGNDTQAGI